MNSSEVNQMKDVKYVNKVYLMIQTLQVKPFINFPKCAMSNATLNLESIFDNNSVHDRSNVWYRFYGSDRS